MNSGDDIRENQQERERCLRDDILDVKEIDWDHVWRSRLARSSSTRRDARFWNGRASSFAKSSTEKAFADQFLAIMKPETHWHVLDMGCGSGALAIPMAKRVSHVTAVDFSDAMLNQVHRQCADEKIRNITTVLGRWEDDWEELGIETCDVAVASRSLMIDDLRTCILKCNEIARKRVYIVTVAGDGPHNRRIFDAVGRPFVPNPDYIYNYNMLYQMGIYANVAFIEEKRVRTYRDADDAIASMRWMFDELNDREEAKLAAFFQKHFVFRDGSWRLPHDTVIRWAVIWWEKK
ncbi:MAG TPA: class I SAM-dependent methyltransferase [Syntrophales bacterium]|nr:class I SAM-dependent methyltransferase [Syntrophales bacterium]HPQ43527.1 class I SAM-dependent methyltransferase [Syntrophales bacterium]